VKLNTDTEIRSAERTLKLSWVIVFGAVLFSVLTVTPLVERVTPDKWDWTAPILPVVVDAAVVIVVRIDAIIARLGGRPGGWSAALRWLTGGLTLALNIGDSALKGDLVGVGVHVVAPILLIVTAEATLTYRRAITAAVERIERERREQREREQREQREREDRSRAEREAVRQAQAEERERERQAEVQLREQERADREREREQAARLAREQREHERQVAEQEREHQAQLERERRDDAARQRREDQDRADRLKREEADRKERERRAQEQERQRRVAAEKAKAAAAVSTPRPTVSATVSAVSTPAHEGAHEAAHEASTDGKMTEADARQAVADAVREGRSQRQVAALTGWSTGWVAKRFQEHEQLETAAA
jgi:hypothetical protein